MTVTGSIASQFAAGSGMAAAAIAVFGFLGHARPLLAGADERRVREAMVRGGLFGFRLAVGVGLLSVFSGILGI
jgi:hypothetical protein